MKIIGFGFTKINAERKYEISEDTIFNHEADFPEIKALDNELIDGKTFNISFKYTIAYNSKKNPKEELAKISLEGFVLVALSGKEADDFEKNWKNKSLTKEETVSLYNFVSRKCSIKMSDIQDELNLPLIFLKPIKAQFKS